jgi:hypothetical protein
MTATHPGFCGLHCRDCEREESERELRDELGCDRPRRVGGAYVACGSCEQCLDRRYVGVPR